jgi:TIR domain-containing protein
VGFETAKYWAFISYSHRDATVAAALQRAIETYHIPRRLVGRSSRMGAVPAYLKPVFRDRNELQAGADLKATVREALRESRYLIAVCSPDAVRSPWVNEEILEFKRLHDGSRVLAVIVAGEPFASRVPGHENEECFPEALRFAVAEAGLPLGEPPEPIAADWREQGDGKRLALLKLVAGMIGLGVDDLIRRDAQRRARRMAVVAAASIAGMAAMGLLTLMAMQSRNEAQSQRAQAEALIEFMLGDLRKKLEPVGRLDVLDAVGEKALGYYAKQDTDRLDANALGRRSRAMHLIGEMREQRGQLEGALDAFKSAAATTAQLLERAPNDGQRIFDHAQSVYWVGYIAWRRGQAQPAEEAFLEYRELATRLVGIDPDNVDWQLEGAYASQNLGVVQLERRRLTEAKGSFLATRDIYVRLARLRPSLANDLSETYGWIAKVHSASGDYAGGIEAQQARLDVLRSIAGADKDRRVQRQIGNANLELSRLHLDLGNAALAERYASSAVEVADALSLSDPANMFWLSEGCFHRVALAEAQIALDRPAAARAQIERTLEDSARLIASDASALNWQVRLKGLVLSQQARIALASGRELPSAELESFLLSTRQLEAAGRRLTSDQAQAVAEIELLLGDALDRQGKTGAASERWRASLERVRSHDENESLPALTLIARAQLRLRQHEQAKAIAARLRNSTFRHPAYAELAQELAQGAGPRQPLTQK